MDPERSVQVWGVCSKLQERCGLLARYYQHIAERGDLDADVTETAAILGGILGGINSDTVELMKLFDVEVEPYDG